MLVAAASASPEMSAMEQMGRHAVEKTSSQLVPEPVTTFFAAQRWWTCRAAQCSREAVPSFGEAWAWPAAYVALFDLSLGFAAGLALFAEPCPSSVDAWAWFVAGGTCSAAPSSDTAQTCRRTGRSDTALDEAAQRAAQHSAQHWASTSLVARYGASQTPCHHAGQ